MAYPTPRLSPDSPVDLQLHTTNSDGDWTPEQLLDHVAAEGFSLIAVTDHDRIDTVPHVMQLGAERGIHVLPAVEMSCSWQGDLVDILCFGFPPGPNPLTEIANRTRQAQLDNVREVYDALRTQGYTFPRSQEVLARSNGNPQHLGDLFDLMQAHGYADEMRSAIRAANYRMITADIPEVVDAAHESGAVALIAHPGRSDGFFQFRALDLDRLRAIAPIDGLEMLHPTHTPELAALYRDYAEQHHLLVSTGSDSHGPSGLLPIKYPASLSKDLLERCGVMLE
jgi:predicted metal-dependent phosphoesterase TrpH